MATWAGVWVGLAILVARRSQAKESCSWSQMGRYEGYLQVETGSRFFEDKQLSEAVVTLELLVRQGRYVDNSVFYSILKRCIAEKDLVLGSRVHYLAIYSGFESNAFVANHIVCMYASHGRLAEATNVFNKVPTPSRYMWASIILAHARLGQPIQAINLYQHMRESTVTPDAHIFVAVLKACATAKDLHSGREVHADILKTARVLDMFLATCLVDMYAKCGSLEDARSVFDRLPSKNVVTWTALIAGYAQHGFGKEALTLYASMQQEGLTPANNITFVSLLQACASIGAVDQGKQLHAQLKERGMEIDVVIGTCLVDMYAKCGSLEDAREVFDNLSSKNMVTWNAMLAGYAKHGHGQQALDLYESSQQEGTTPVHAVTFVCLLQACASIGALHQGRRLHAQIQEKGLEADLVIGTCLVDMYAKCGSLGDARTVFDNLLIKDVVTWNVMIAGYAQQALREEAFNLYVIMRAEGINIATPVTFICLLQACARDGAFHHGEQLHAHIQEQSLEADVVVGTCLVDMYAKCGSFADARRVFDSLPHKNVVTWTAMIAGYAQNGLSEEAISLYASMQQEGITPADTVTYVCVLQACGSVAGLEKGKEIHAEISKLGLEATTDLFVASTMIDMYGKCGSMDDAQQVFDALPARDIVTWNALIAGYAHQGESAFVFKLLHRMSRDGIQPNDITFVGVLTACSHAGLVEKGQEYFKIMGNEYGISPTVEHYNCIIDLLGRGGQVEEAMEMVKAMPFQPPGEMWRCLLGACQKWRKVELGRQAFEHAVRLEKNDAAAYVLMSNIYAGAHMWLEAKEIQAMRVRGHAWKKPAQCWWADVGGVVHTFLVGDVECNERDPLHEKLKDVSFKLKEDGYVQMSPMCWLTYKEGSINNSDVVDEERKGDRPN